MIFMTLYGVGNCLLKFLVLVVENPVGVESVTWLMERVTESKN